MKEEEVDEKRFEGLLKDDFVASSPSLSVCDHNVHAISISFETIC